MRRADRLVALCAKPPPLIRFLIMTSALLIIDLQQGLCSGEEAAYDIANVLARINRLADRARQADVPVLLIQHEEADGPLQRGSAAWQLADGLEVGETDLRMAKTTPNSFHGTALKPLLDERRVDVLVICGLQTQFCVDTTVRQALALGYAVVLASDAHSTPGSPGLSPQQVITHHNQTLRWLTSFGPAVSLTPADEVRFEG